MTQRLKRIISAGLCLLVVASGSPGILYAASSPTGSGLSISPTISQYTLKPNQVATLEITVKNVTTGDVTAQAQVADFIPDGTIGAPKIIGPPNPTTPNSIKKFVGTLYDVPLSVGQQKKISVTLDPPDGTAPGAYYGVIKYRAIPAGDNIPNPDQIALTASVATIVLITVPGNLREQVQLSGIHIYHGTRDARIFFSKPESIGVEIRNLGNGFERPFGTVEVQNTFGKSVDTFQFNNPKQLGNVLPNSTRIFNSPVSGVSQIGRYTVTVNAAYGSGGNVLTLTKTFWYIPAWLALTVLALIILLIIMTVRLYLRFRRGDRHSYRNRR